MHSGNSNMTCYPWHSLKRSVKIRHATNVFYSAAIDENVAGKLRHAGHSIKQKNSCPGESVQKEGIRCNQAVSCSLHVMGQLLVKSFSISAMSFKSKLASVSLSKIPANILYPV